MVCHLFKESFPHLFHPSFVTNVYIFVENLLAYNTYWHLFICCFLADCVESVQSCHLIYKLRKHRKYVLYFSGHFLTDAAYIEGDGYIQMY